MLQKVLIGFVIVAAFVIGTTYIPKQMSEPGELTDFSGLYDPDNVNGWFHGKKFASRYIPFDPVLRAAGQNVLGAASDKRIEVDLSKQRLYAYLGDILIFDFPVSTGKWWPTPTGTFRIWTKFRYTKMEGGNKAWNTYYYLPNVPFTMFFANDEVPPMRGFGIHGAYWHNNFGHPMSHGCVNMAIPDAEQLYYWADPMLGDKTSIRATPQNPGTMVIIYGETPKE